MLIIAFLMASMALFLQGIILPRIAILAFAPFIALVMMRCEMSRALWMSALSGCLVDLLSDDPIGLHALNYTIVAFILYRVKNHFSYDQPFHLSLYTSFVSSLSTGLQLMLLFLFDRRVPFDGRWFLADFIGMPVIDALYAFVWFAAPLVLFDKLKRIWVLFWLKKKTLSHTSHSSQ
jgi:rod shape-determining protein MreD